MLVDEYTPLKFDSVPMVVEHDTNVPRSSKSKRSTSKKSRKEKFGQNKSPVRKHSNSESSEPSRTGKSTPKATNFRLNPASGNSSKPFNSNVFEITPAGSSKPLPIRGAQPPDEKSNGCVAADELMDVDLVVREPKTESEEGESVFESLMNDDTDCEKKEENPTARKRKPSLRRSVRKSAVTTKSNGTSENNDVETNSIEITKVDAEADETISVPKRRSSTNGTNANKSIKGEPLSEEKPNGYNVGSLGGEVVPQKSRKSAVKPKTKNSSTVSRAESEENSAVISEPPLSDGLSNSKTDVETKNTAQNKNSLRRSVRKSTGTGKPNGVPESNGVAEIGDAPPTAKVDVEPSEAVTATKRKPTSDEDGPLPKKRRSRPVQRYEPPY